MKFAVRLIRSAILALFALCILFPLYITLLTSLKSSGEVYDKPLSLPEIFLFSNYTTAWFDGKIGDYFMNSVIVTGISLAAILVFGGMASYSLSKSAFAFGKWLYPIFLVGIMIPIQVYMVPLYLLVSKLGLGDSHTGLVLCYVSMKLSFAIFIITGFYRTISKEIVHAAEIDGCSEFQLFRHLYVPMAKPAFATVAILSVVNVWNDVVLPLLFLRGNELKTIPVGLINFRGEFLSDYSLLFAGVIISSIPLLVLYSFLQQWFVRGLTTGAVKG